MVPAPAVVILVKLNLGLRCLAGKGEQLGFEPFLVRLSARLKPQLRNPAKLSESP